MNLIDVSLCFIMPIHRSLRWNFSRGISHNFQGMQVHYDKTKLEFFSYRTLNMLKIAFFFSHARPCCLDFHNMTRTDGIQFRMMNWFR